MILVNGVQTDCVAASDRGLMYGDGVFRTMVMCGGQPVSWDRHFLKLSADCAALRIPCIPKEIFDRELETLGASHPDCVIKIVVTRGEGTRGYSVTSALQPTRILSTSPMPTYPDAYREVGVKVRLCDLRLSYQPQLAGIKHLNRLENVLARIEWDNPDIPEGLLLDEHGIVISGTMSNLVLFKGETLVTPDLSRCGVAGVTRQRIMSMVAEWGFQVKVQPISLQVLMEADEVLMCNSVIGVWQIVEFQEKAWPAGNLVHRIRAALHDGN